MRHPYLTEDGSYDNREIFGKAMKSARRIHRQQQLPERTAMRQLLGLAPQSFGEVFQQSLKSAWERAPVSRDQFLEIAALEQMTPKERVVANLRRDLDCAVHANRYDGAEIARLNRQIALAERDVITAAEMSEAA